jgi:N-formylglutamate deformylase
MEPYRFYPGHTPLLVSMPHVGTHVPEALARRMTKAALDVPDTDWNVDRLYDFLGADGAGVLAATHSRYVIDLNRPPDNRPLYPGASNTELCPLTLFDDSPIYVERGGPEPEEVADRLDRYWRPYHHHLAETLAAVRGKGHSERAS